MADNILTDADFIDSESSLSPTYVQPTWGESAKYAGQSFGEGVSGLIALSDLFSPLGLAHVLAGREGSGQAAARGLSDLIGTPDKNIVGAAPRYARAVMNALPMAAAGGPMTTALSALGSQYAKERGGGILTQILLGTAAGGLPGVTRGIGQFVKNVGRSLDFRSLGLDKVGKSLFLRNRGMTRAQAAAEDLLQEGKFPFIRTPEINRQIMMDEFKKAGNAYEGDLAQLDEAIPGNLSTSIADDFIENRAAAGDRKVLRRIWEKRLKDYEDNARNEFSELKRERSRLSQMAFDKETKIRTGSDRGLYAAMAEDYGATMDDVAKSVLSPKEYTDWLKLNQSYGNWSNIAPALEKAAERGIMEPTLGLLKHGASGTAIGVLGHMAGIPALGNVAGAAYALSRHPLTAGMGGAIIRGLFNTGKAIENGLPAIVRNTANSAYASELSPFYALANAYLNRGDNGTAFTEPESFFLRNDEPDKEYVIPDLNGVSLNENTEAKMPFSEAALDALRKVESGNSKNPNITSYKGARGPYQFMPSTWKSVANILKLPADGWKDEEVARKGARYLLDTALKKYGDPRLAMAAYNAGEPAVDSFLSKTKNKTWEEVSRLMNKHEGYKETVNYVPAILGEIGLRYATTPNEDGVG